MDISALTPQVVARIVLKEQEQTLTKTSRFRTLPNPFARTYIPYGMIRADSDVEITSSSSCKTLTVADEPEEGEIIEKEEDGSDALITNASSLRSSLTLPSSLHTPITPATYVPAKPVLVNELCQTFTSTGTNIYNLPQVCCTSTSQLTLVLGSCTAICPHVHDPTKLALCESRIKRLLCAKSPACRQSHVWTFNNAPTCANFLMNRCCVRGTNCGFAHNEKVSLASAHCEAFSRLGYCELGGECSKIHWFNFIKTEMDQPTEIYEDSTMREDDVSAKMKATKARVLQFKKARREARDTEKTKRRIFSGDMWAKEPEEFLNPAEVKGDLALQEDFVPF